MQRSLHRVSRALRLQRGVDGRSRQRLFRRARTRRLMRILLSRPDRVGDLILSTPAIASMRRAFPQAHITIVCTDYNAVVVEHNPDVDYLETLPTGVEPVAFGRTFRGRSISRSRLRRASPICGWSPRRAHAGASATPTSARSWRVLPRAAGLTDFLISEADPALASADHEPHPCVTKLSKCLRSPSAPVRRVSCYDLELPISDATAQRSRIFPDDAITVHFAQRWLQRRQHDRESGRAVRRAARSRAAARRDLRRRDGRVRRALAAGAIDRVAGGLTFRAWAAAFERSACIVTVDTGATHVASAVRGRRSSCSNTATSGSNSQEWSPYRVPNAVLRKPADRSAGSARSTRAARSSRPLRRLLKQ